MREMYLTSISELSLIKDISDNNQNDSEYKRSDRIIIKQNENEINK